MSYDTGIPQLDTINEEMPSHQFSKYCAIETRFYLFIAFMFPSPSDIDAVHTTLTTYEGNNVDNWKISMIERGHDLFEVKSDEYLKFIHLIADAAGGTPINLDRWHDLDIMYLLMLHVGLRKLDDQQLFWIDQFELIEPYDSKLKHKPDLLLISVYQVVNQKWKSRRNPVT